MHSNTGTSNAVPRNSIPSSPSVPMTPFATMPSSTSFQPPIVEQNNVATFSHEIVHVSSNGSSPESNMSSSIETLMDVPSRPSLFQQMMQVVAPQQMNEAVVDMDIDNLKRKREQRQKKGKPSTAMVSVTKTYNTRSSRKNAPSINGTQLKIPDEDIDTVAFYD